MKILYPDPPQIGAPYSPARAELPTPAIICEPETVMVVDDDESIRELEAYFLSQNGYQVLQASGTEEALRLAAATANIDLLLTDYAMPDGNGLELTHRLRTLHPETPVLIVSGSLPMVHDHTWDLDRFAILAKPFTFEELDQNVRKLLSKVAPLPLQAS